MNYKLGHLFVYHAYQEFLEFGIECVLGTSTNPISVKVAVNFGGKVLREEKIKRNGKEATMYLCEMRVEDMKEKFRPKL